MAKPLLTAFQGKGQVSLYAFTQLKASDQAYMYQLEDELGNKHYEVFKHKINSQFDTVSYPSDKAFGAWAWCIKNYDKAIEKFDSLHKLPEIPVF